MLFSFGFYSSLLLIFFVHTVVYSLLFLFKYQKQHAASNWWMSLFLILAALYICPWMLGFAGWYNTQPYRDILFYVPFQHLFLIGPVIFFYLQSVFNPRFTITRKELVHFLPCTLYLIFCVVMFVYDKLIVHDYYFLKSQQDPDFDSWYQLTGFISMIAYLILSIKYYNEYKKAIEAVLSNAANFLFTWIRNFLIAFLIMLIAWVSITLFGFFFDLGYVNNWWYFFSFSIITYYIAIAGYSNAVETKIFFKSKIFSKENEVMFLENKALFLLETQALNFQEISSVGHVASDAAQQEFSEFKLKIERLFESETLFKQPELTLFDVAKKMGLNISILSKIINQSFNLNFNDLVNRYRINAVIDLLQLGEHKKQTLLSIAFECGFNSKSTFNRAFKKEKGVSPQDFLKSMHL